MKPHAFAYLFTAVVLLAGCAGPGSQRGVTASVSTRQPLTRLGNYHFKVTARSVAAQRAFDRGLTLAYSFGHFAAEREFRRAAEADPDCAMAWWGVALVNGPHINFPLVPPPRGAAAWEAITRAKALAARTTPLEQDLIAALGKRYADPHPADRSGLDEAYATAMRGLYQKYPEQADVATLFAEAEMDLHPWNYWSREGEPRPWTPEIIAALERALRLSARHPGANHFYIHAMEASREPGKALASANRLGRLVPDSGHMVHMPSHIYARVGAWDKAAVANRRAMEADARYRAAYPRPGFYAMYMLHNAHFLAFVAMMRGDSAEAIRCARQVVAGVPEDFRQDYPGIADGYMAIVPETLMRFGRWQEILREPEPDPALPLARALWRFTRAAALNALERPEEAKAEQAAFEAASAQVPPESMMGNNYGTNLLAIAARVLAGEISAQAGAYSDAISHLGEAVKVEDTLVYDEPPTWIQPVRHTLGAVLLKAGKAPEAEAVYRDELRRNPENGWSLMGLRETLKRQNKFDEAQAVNARWKKAWAEADIKPPSTCYCQKLDS